VLVKQPKTAVFGQNLGTNILYASSQSVNKGVNINKVNEKDCFFYFFGCPQK